MCKYKARKLKLNFTMFYAVWGDFPGSSSKEPPCQCKRHQRCWLDPWVGKIPWRRAWQPTPVFLPGESHGEGSLAGYIVHGVSKSRIWLKRLSMHTCSLKGQNIGSWWNVLEYGDVSVTSLSALWKLPEGTQRLLPPPTLMRCRQWLRVDGLP